MMHENELARADYAEAVNRLTQPNTASSFNALASYQIGLGRYEEAVANSSKAISMQSRADFFHTRGWAYVHLGQLDKALADIDKALEMDAFDAGEVYYHRAVLNERLGNATLAAEDRRMANKLGYTRLDPAAH